MCALAETQELQATYVPFVSTAYNFCSWLRPSLWAKLFNLVRTGHSTEALDEALVHRQAIEHREDGFVIHFRLWSESPDRRYVVHPCSLLQLMSQLSPNHVVYRSPIGNTSRPSTMRTCYIQQVSIHLSSLFISSWVSWTRPSEPFHWSRQRPRIGSGFNLQWYVFSVSFVFFAPIELVQVDEEENGGLHGLPEVLLIYGECHFEGAPDPKVALTGWAAVLPTCGESERVSDLPHASHRISDGVCHFRLFQRSRTNLRQRSRQSTWPSHWLTMVYNVHLLLSHLTLHLVSGAQRIGFGPPKYDPLSVAFLFLPAYTQPLDTYLAICAQRPCSMCTRLLWVQITNVASARSSLNSRGILCGVSLYLPMPVPRGMSLSVGIEPMRCVSYANFLCLVLAKNAP